ncbi:class I SAM-dependent methyltransferase [Natronorubrum halalkaliphilum]|uniref:class I SAM-dependent methyltransferase n=1 Tax=Natronorubrum halalkaliphilum TaxID=2691917 RepID=UPI003CCC29FD
MESAQPYLEAKRTLDDRALNRRVLEQFATALSARGEPVRIVELGAGVGTMIARLADWSLLPDRVSYRAVDRDAASIERARELVPAHLESTGYDVEWLESPAGATVEGGGGDDVPKSTTLVARPADEPASDSNQRLEITLEVADALDIDDRADAVIAAALLDIVDLENAIPALEGLLVDGGVCYAPITFNGGTTFAPRDRLDERIERQYHRHMDEIRDGGRSRAGSALLATLSRSDWDVLASGGSDWVVVPADGGYSSDEKRVVVHVLETIDEALADVASDALEADERTRWLERRRRELEAGDLVFVAHNLDVLARIKETQTP